MSNTVPGPDVPDCRKQFSLMKPRILKRWLAIILVFIGTIPYMAVMQHLVGYHLTPESFNGFVMLPYALLYLALIFSLFGFRCPNCGKSLYVLAYLWKVPLLTKTW